MNVIPRRDDEGLTLTIQLLNRVVRLLLSLVQDECVSCWLVVEPRWQVDFDAAPYIRCVQCLTWEGIRLTHCLAPC